MSKKLLAAWIGAASIALSITVPLAPAHADPQCRLGKWGVTFCYDGAHWSACNVPGLAPGQCTPLDWPPLASACPTCSEIGPVRP
jgi:hypothetical protein